MVVYDPEISYQGTVITFKSHPFVQSPIERDLIDLETTILKIEQHETTVYVKGYNRNVIIVHLGWGEKTKVLHEYSHEIPTWMKDDFNRFLRE
ncbi:hypothetical protein CF651_22960 [Paenibacillus rigui]|uniref:Uncharacterized protein n=1 Tax=Paenibacillus rigui TaxID=554312 RepID=A0A229UKZ4_9BACL|nr:hypothetical protein CF651_22960 [Paenibacillus rigui]